ncbi:CAP domain-containing protein [Sorangium sp. So ce1036]|uniref:CAP domain-containing protein n=1 Tax=Sorangium sp. So ce1036 TaxID=3133328 RepID=UPI003F066DFF
MRSWWARGACCAALAAAGTALAAAGAAAADPPALTWVKATRSPQPAAALAPEVAALTARCGAADAALAAVARRNVERQLQGGEIMPPDELAFTLRAAGAPHAWPRGWSIAGQGLGPAELGARIDGWLSGWPTLGVRRCGVAHAKKPDGTVIAAAVGVDALADMSPLPTTARVGQWVTLEGTMRVPATAVKVVLLGPRGAPRAVLSSLSGARIRSSFAVDQPGSWLVQVLATVSTGPRPVLEAMIFAGGAPPGRYVRAPSPGEEAARGARDDDDAMLRMMNAARASEGLPALARDAALSALARAHAEAMLKARMVGHDVGSGDPAARLRAAGYEATIAGENVATSSSPGGAHRAIWASPSHRGNLLDRRYRKTGVAVVRDRSGRVWVAQLFAG